jgi:hypothetical protein
MPVGCRTLVATLIDREETGGDPLASAGARLHLAICGDCHRYVQQARAVRAALGALGTGGVAGATKARLMARFRDWAAKRST